jgi:hypothetical protein
MSAKLAEMLLIEAACATAAIQVIALALSLAALALWGGMIALHMIAQELHKINEREDRK